MKFFFLGGKRYKAIHTELKAVPGEEVVSLATVKRWCQRFKQGDFSLDKPPPQSNPLRINITSSCYSTIISIINSNQVDILCIYLLLFL
jgi:hypothetical protein